MIRCSASFETPGWWCPHLCLLNCHSSNFMLLLGPSKIRTNLAEPRSNSAKSLKIDVDIRHPWDLAYLRLSAGWKERNWKLSWHFRDLQEDIAFPLSPHDLFLGGVPEATNQPSWSWLALTALVSGIMSILVGNFYWKSLVFVPN